MAKALKTKRRDKNFRKLKSAHFWVPLVTFSVLYFLIGMIVMAAFVSLMDYAVTARLASEYNEIRYMAGVYDQTGDDTLLELSGRPFFFMDEAGAVTKNYGDNTCSFEAAKFNLTFEMGQIMCYLDKECKLYYIDNNGFLITDLNYLVKSVSSRRKEIQDTLGEYGFYLNSDVEVGNEYRDSDTGVVIKTENDLMEAGNKVMLYYPIWISVPVKDGNLVVKAFFTMNMNDTVLAMVITGLLVFAVAVAVIIMLINLFRNVAQQKQSLRIFTTDLVTGGHNWIWFLIKGEKYLRSWSAAKRKYAVVNVMFVDYRTYCVCHSVEAGDEVLVRMHRVLNRNMKKHEMCVHTTSSNFALLLNCPDLDLLKERLDSFMKLLSEIGGDNNLHFQMGIAPIDIMTNQKGRIVRRKDFDLEAEYNNACAARNTMAKRSESGIAVFDDKLVEEKRWISTVTEHQRQALANEEFVVYYQPKCDPATERLKGAEALVRWQSPEFGFVPPGKFIPIFEDNGFITEIDHYMLRHVARDQKRWLDEGMGCVPVSVNVSRAHFIESDLAEQIRDIVDSEGTPHEYIEIELTESAFFDDKAALINTITRLQSYGFAVSMDDFGSGYSSLNSLKDMPLDVLKLDAEFFRGENAGERGKIVVSEAIRLAKDLNMRVVAEGVEEKGQVDFLASQGCDMIQGFVFAKPMPGDGFVNRMKLNDEAGSSGPGTAENMENTDVTEKTENAGKVESLENAGLNETTELAGSAGEAEAIKTVETAGITETTETAGTTEASQ